MLSEYWMLTEHGVTNVVTSPDTHKIEEGMLFRVVGGIAYSSIPLDQLYETREAALQACRATALEITVTEELAATLLRLHGLALREGFPPLDEDIVRRIEEKFPDLKSDNYFRT